MRKVVASPFTSLDGFMSGPNGEIEWNMPYFDEEMASFVQETLGSLDTLLFGRVTYEWFAQFWPNEGVKQDPGHAGLMNSLPKISGSAIRAWQRILGRVPNSRLMVKAGLAFSTAALGVTSMVDAPVVKAAMVRKSVYRSISCSTMA